MPQFDRGAAVFSVFRLSDEVLPDFAAIVVGLPSIAVMLRGDSGREMVPGPRRNTSRPAVRRIL